MEIRFLPFPVTGSFGCLSVSSWDLFVQLPPDVGVPPNPRHGCTFGDSVQEKQKRGTLPETHIAPARKLPQKLAWIKMLNDPLRRVVPKPGNREGPKITDELMHLNVEAGVFFDPDSQKLTTESVGNPTSQWHWM